MRRRRWIHGSSHGVAAESGAADHRFAGGNRCREAVEEIDEALHLHICRRCLRRPESQPDQCVSQRGELWRWEWVRTAGPQGGWAAFIRVGLRDKGEFSSSWKMRWGARRMCERRRELRRYCVRERAPCDGRLLRARQPPRSRTPQEDRLQEGVDRDPGRRPDVRELRRARGGAGVARELRFESGWQRGPRDYSAPHVDVCAWC